MEEEKRQEEVTMSSSSSWFGAVHSVWARPSSRVLEPPAVLFEPDAANPRDLHLLFLSSFTSSSPLNPLILLIIRA